MKKSSVKNHQNSGILRRSMRLRWLAMRKQNTTCNLSIVNYKHTLPRNQIGFASITRYYFPKLG